MFDDARSRKVILLAHCLLNQNAISDGTADLPAQFTEILGLLARHRVGLIQLPCPEALCLGLDRRDPAGATRPLLEENTRIRALMEEDDVRATLAREAARLADLVEDYRRHGFQVLGVLGVDRSPSCGVGTTSRACEERPGRGVFMEILAEALATRGIALPMLGTRTGDRERSVEHVRRFLEA